MLTHEHNVVHIWPLTNNPNEISEIQKELYPNFVKKDDSSIRYRVFPSYSQHLGKIKNAIQEKNAEELRQYLGYFIEDWILEHRAAQAGLDQNGMQYSVPARYGLFTKPFLCEVFDKEPDDFIGLIDLISASNQECYSVFIEKIAQDIPDLRFGILNESQSLFLWDDKIKGELESTIAALKSYGQKLKAKGIAKGETIETLVEGLSQQVSDFNGKVGSADWENKEDWKRNLEVLKFKVQVRKTLHSQDKIINHYRGPGRLIANTISFLFTLTLANWAYLYRTGDKFLFFNQVTSKNLVRDLDQKLLGETEVFPKMKTL